MEEALKQPCKRHKVKKMNYLEYSDYLENKIKHGAKQKQCKKCKKYFFKDEM
jgi:hypothetical protein